MYSPVFFRCLGGMVLYRTGAGVDYAWQTRNRRSICEKHFGTSIGREGQAKIFQARVLIVGAGGLGSPAAFYLGRGAASTTDTFGVLGAVAGVVGSLQAAEAVKIILGKDSLLTGRLVLIDCLKMRFREEPVLKKYDCPDCSV